MDENKLTYDVAKLSAALPGNTNMTITEKDDGNFVVTLTKLNGLISQLLIPNLPQDTDELVTVIKNGEVVPLNLPGDRAVVKKKPKVEIDPADIAKLGELIEGIEEWSTV